jgi:hypothetical protein
MKFTKMTASILIITSCIAISSSFTQTNLTIIPSDAGGPKGIVVDIITPTSPRYQEGAPIIIYVVGGLDGNGLPSDKNAGLDQEGFIEIHFSWPGLGFKNQDFDVRSGGIYDYRGPDCLKALRDVILFAMNKLADKNGNKLSDLTSGITPMIDNIGMIGLSNGGNSTIAVAGVYGDTLSDLAWIVNYESPVGDGMVGAEAGSKSTNPNTAYDPSNGTWDLSTLAYDDTISISGGHIKMPSSKLKGGLYFDLNKNNQPDMDTDFILYPIKYPVLSDTTVYYSERVCKEAKNRGLIPLPVPKHIAKLPQTEDFWHWRNGENWITNAVQKNPDLMFLVYAFEQDHVQTAPDHPHVLIQYEGFRTAGARFVRLNPDRSYVENVTGTIDSRIVDNDAFKEFDHMSIRTAVLLNEIANSNKITRASACELADRTYWNILDPQVDDVITSSVPDAISYISPSAFRLNQNFPNPFNSSTEIMFSVPVNDYVSLNIYNMKGQMVKQLTSQYYSKGEYKISWIGDDDSGNFVPSGLYYCWLEAGDFVQVRKVVLVK